MMERLRLRPGSTMAGAAINRSDRRGRRRKAALRIASLSLLGLYAALFLLDDGVVPSIDAIRNLRGGHFARSLESCMKTPYLLVRDVVGHMPVVIPPPLRNPPSHVRLCSAYLDRREKYGDVIPDAVEPFPVMEDEALCSDWSAPHHSLLHIFASSLIARVGSKYGLRYQHRCQRTLPHLNSRDVHFDYTSVQMLLMETLTSEEDKSAVSDDEMVRLCKGCIAEYETVIPPEFSYSASSHQCLLFPGDQPVTTPGSLGRAHNDGEERAQEEQAIAENSQAALATVLKSLTERLREVAEDHLPFTDPLENEDRSGACIFVDDTVTGMSPWVYDKYIPEYVTSIQVFASASCAHAAVHNRHTCIAHGGAVRRYLVSTRRNAKVRYDVVASTAASYARLIHCHKVICPPGSVGCMLPALVKVPGTTATVASASLSPNTQKWYEHLAAAQIELETMEVLELTEDEQVMQDENGMEFVSGAMEREGNLTFPVSRNGTVAAGEEGDVEIETETEGGEREFVQEAQQPQGQASSQEEEKGGGQSSGPSVAYNADGSITIAARSNTPPNVDPRTTDNRGGGDQEHPPLQQQEGQGQQDEGGPQMVQEAPEEDQDQEGPQMVQAAPEEAQDQEGPQLVQAAPEEVLDQRGPQMVQAAPQEALPPQQPDRSQLVQAAAEAQEQEAQAVANQASSTQASEEKTDKKAERESEAGAEGGGGGRRLKKLFDSLWGGSSSSKAEQPAAASVPSRVGAPDAAGGVIQ
mmetsp:Transcript_48951/g.147459  ORF Transcript_48951/g.147459 Transcript_48951/m.147459 type:complete len:752 (-) Transcript_48951:62-2317(-)